MTGSEMSECVAGLEFLFGVLYYDGILIMLGRGLLLSTKYETNTARTA
jgi:hypothetical protein